MSRDIRSQAAVFDLGDAKPLRSPFSVSVGIEAIPKICCSAADLATCQPEASRVIANVFETQSDLLRPGCVKLAGFGVSTLQRAPKDLSKLKFDARFRMVVATRRIRCSLSE